MASETYCSYPFTQLAMKWYEGERLISAWPCCNMGNEHAVMLDIPDQHALTPQEIFDHPAMQQIRHNLAHGVRDPHCDVCWRMEDRGLISYRMRDTTLHEPKLRCVDIRTSNVCNLRCRMCAPNNSHSLAIDHAFFQRQGLLDEARGVLERWPSPDDRSQQPSGSAQWDWLLANTAMIDHVKASGGEPFLDRQFVELLQRYQQDGTAGHTTLEIHTNGTHLSEDMLELLSSFKKLTLHFSVDAYGKLYQYIRHPQPWPELAASLERYHQHLGPLHMSFVVVVSALNLLNLDQLIDWVSHSFPSFSIGFDELQPKHRGTALHNLAPHLLMEGKDRLQRMATEIGDLHGRESQVIKMIDAAMRMDMQDQRKLRREIELFDLSRNQSYTDYLDPMLVDWLDTTINTFTPSA